MSAIEASSCTAALHHHRLVLQSAARSQWYSSKNRTTVSAPLSVMVGFRVTLPYVASLWLGLYQHIYSESLALRGRIYTAKADQVAVQNQTTTPSFFCSTATPLYYPAALSGLLQVYNPSLSEEGSKCGSPLLKVDTFAPCSAMDTQVGLKEGIISLWQVAFFYASIL